MTSRPFWNNWSLAKITLFVMLVPLLLMSFILTHFQIDDRLQDMTDILTIEGEVIAQSVADDSQHFMFIGDRDKLQHIVSVAAVRSAVAYLEILDGFDNIIVSAGTPVSANKRLSPGRIKKPIIYKDVFANEINQSIEPLSVTVGWVRLELSPKIISEKKKNIIFSSLMILVGGLLFSAALAFLLSRSLIRPITNIISFVENISAGKFNHKLRKQYAGELGELESGINKMASELQLSNQQQQKRIDQATQALMELVLQLEQKNVLLDEARKEAEEIGNSKVEFLANMSHEIRTPLNAVIGASDLLMKLVKESEAEKYMSTLSVASRQLNSVVDDILDFSRMEANKLELEYVAFNIIEVLESVIALHTPMAQEKNLELKLQVASGMPPSLFGDPFRLSQVIGNLVSNAVKFTEKGQVIVRASSVVVNNISLRLQVDVKDTGAGLSDSAQEKLFDAFSQADNAVARKYGGSGLGLAIVRKLIEQMQGFIKVKSTIDKGTVFSVYLDLKLDKRKTDDLEKDLSGLSVLLYEKDRVTEKTVKNVLVYWGVEVTACKSDDDFIGHLMKYKKDNNSCDCVVLGMQRERSMTSSIEGCVERIRHLSAMPIVMMLNPREYILPDKVIDEQVCCISRPVNRQLLNARLNSVKNKETSIAEGACDIQSIEERSASASVLKNLKVLVAEDNLFNRELLTDMLTSFGAKVTAVEDGQFAVEAALTGDFDIILLDLHMPRKDGITAANEIKQAGLKKQPFLVAATADVFIKDQGKDVEAFDSFVFKPIRQEVLLERLASLINYQGDYDASVADDVVTDALSEKLDQEVRKLVFLIVEGSNNNDFEEIKKYAHQLRGVCGFYELTEMTVVASGLENAAKENKREAVALLIKVLLKQLKISPDYKQLH
jgi:two-component system sensor histidine kinase BarA